MKNVCVVGYGAVGPVHAAALEKIQNAQLYAVCDINPQKLKRCSSQYGCKEFSDFDEMLLDTNIDAVHICTPHYLHKEMAVKALNAGKAVVLEKPVGISFIELIKFSVEVSISLIDCLSALTFNCSSISVNSSLKA